MAVALVPLSAYRDEQATGVVGEVRMTFPVTFTGVPQGIDRDSVTVTLNPGAQTAAAMGTAIINAVRALATSHGYTLGAGEVMLIGAVTKG
jgi:6-phosphofructokinase